jgi:hypothetical protein
MLICRLERGLEVRKKQWRVLEVNKLVFGLLTSVDTARMDLGLVLGFRLKFFPNLTPVLRHIEIVQIHIQQNFSFMGCLLLISLHYFICKYDLIWAVIIYIAKLLPFFKHLLAVNLNA